MKIKGLGGTIIQPAIDLVADKFNNFSTILLTDGETDDLNVSKLKNKLLVLSVNREVNFIGNKHVEQIIIKRDQD